MESTVSESNSPKTSNHTSTSKEKEEETSPPPPTQSSSTTPLGDSLSRTKKLGIDVEVIESSDDFEFEEDQKILGYYEGITEEEVEKMIKIAISFSSKQKSRLFDGFVSQSICIRSSSRNIFWIYHNKEKTARIHRILCQLKANSAVEFSGPLMAISSHDVIPLFRGVPMFSDSSWRSFAFGQGGRPFYRNGTDKLLGAIGISGDTPEIDEKNVLNTIYEMGFSPRPNLSILVDEPTPLIELGGNRYFLYTAAHHKGPHKTVEKIYDKLEKKDLCEHIFKNPKEYFDLRSKSQFIEAICPKCVQMRPNLMIK